MLINNDFVFLPIPRNATTSIYLSLKNWEIPIDFGLERINTELKNNTDTKHPHFDYHVLKQFFPDKQFVGLYRNPTDRFISSVYYILNMLLSNKNYDIKYNFLQFSNSDYISFFSEFLIEYSNEIKNNVYNHNIDFTNYFIKNKLNKNRIEYHKLISAITTLLSQYFWGIQYCDEIIDFKNINQLEEKIKLKAINFNLINTNKSNFELNLKLKKTDELEQFVFDYIDSPFIKP